MGFISSAFADGGASTASEAGGGMNMFVLLALFAVIFYFMIFRPQSKRNKEQKNLMNSLAKGSEIITSSGILGKIVKLTDSDYVVIAINDTTEITIKKDFIAAVLPKGSIKTL